MMGTQRGQNAGEEMSREDILRIICDCIAAVGIAPSDWQETCETTKVGDLNLGEDGIKAVILCILEKLKERGYGAGIGEGNFPAEATVGDVGTAVYNNQFELDQ